ncbi:MULTISPECIES: DUF2017 domain-containing protein [Kocuria]|uniref:DUF2017 domain-containing protein n=1 Tax=Kocuria TaxID=57493 RepID=UPI0006615DF5|nr:MULTISPECIES: DUF2017 domain-containing protein [Kocuria]MCT1368240.1 DUF2017 domain-containing protein [Rothia sp. p3-SID1597]RUQ22406.1 DUF2017 domain-containing protein [Kocuria sp. HSID16901]
MAKEFKNGRKGIVGGLEGPERELLIKLFHDVITTLEPESRGENEDPLEALVGITDDPEIPEDPALRRLLPQASDDDEAATEFRRYTERGVRESKIAHLRMAAMDCEAPKLVLNPEHAMAFASALNDVRLVVATRLGIESEEDAQRVAEYTDWSQARDVESYMSLVYQFVSWLQDSLVEAMLADLD